MKTNTLLHIVSGAVLTMSAYSCSNDEIETYDGPGAGIYFQQVASTDVDGNPLSFTDSISFSFAGYESSHTEHPLRFYIGTMGKLVDYDRTYKLIYDAEASTAEEGVDFDLLRNDFMIHANQARDTVIVTLKRSQRIRNERLVLRFRLEPNEYFTIPVDSFKNSTNWSDDAPMLPTDKFTVSVSEIYNAPFNWRHFGEEYFGVFSVSKMLEIEKVMGWTYRDWQNASSNKVAVGKFGFAARQLHNHLQGLADAGTPVLDDDGKYMQLPGDYAVDYSAYENK